MKPFRLRRFENFKTYIVYRDAAWKWRYPFISYYNNFYPPWLDPWNKWENNGEAYLHSDTDVQGRLCSVSISWSTNEGVEEERVKERTGVWIVNEVWKRVEGAVEKWYKRRKCVETTEESRGKEVHFMFFTSLVKKRSRVKKKWKISSKSNNYQNKLSCCLSNSGSLKTSNLIRIYPPTYCLCSVHRDVARIFLASLGSWSPAA